MIKYPTMKSVDRYNKQKYHNTANQGMALEEMINQTNAYYQQQKIAFIHKRPTNVKVLKTNEESQITKAVFLSPSTLDYVGVFQGRYLDFEAKETTSKKGFPMGNIAPHQIQAMESILYHQGITFAIIFLKAYEEIYLLDGQFLIDAYHNHQTIIPYEEIKKNASLIKAGFFTNVDYIQTIKEKYFDKK